MTDKRALRAKRTNRRKEDLECAKSLEKIKNLNFLGIKITHHTLNINISSKDITMNKSSNNQNYNKISRTYRYTILFILACMHISTNVHGVSVSVGAVNFSNAASDSQGAEADVTIDGDRGGLQDGHGWSPTFGADDPAIALPHTIQWNL